MIVRKSKKKTMQNFIKGNINEVEVIIPNISDHIMSYADEDLGLDTIIENNTDCKTHVDGIPPVLFHYGLISAKLKRLFSVSSSVLAITTSSIIDKFELNIVSNEEFTCEGNMPNL